MATPTPSPPCGHPKLAFERGGFYVKCASCGQLWRAVAPNGLTPLYGARMWGLGARDVREE